MCYFISNRKDCSPYWLDLFFQEFISHFSESLHYEMKQYNIHVQSLMPMYVATNMTSFSKILNQSSLITPTPVTYVNQAMRTLGLYRVNTGYFPHTVQVSILVIHHSMADIRITVFFFRLGFWKWRPAFCPSNYLTGFNCNWIRKGSPKRIFSFKMIFIFAGELLQQCSLLCMLVALM